MKKLCILALTLVLTLSAFVGCGCTNSRNPAGMKPTDMTTVPTTAATTAPTAAPTTAPATAPTTTPTEEMTMPTMDATDSAGDMPSDPTDTMDGSTPSERSGSVRGGSRTRTVR